MLIRLLTNKEDGGLNLNLFKLDNQSFVDQILEIVPEAALLSTATKDPVEKRAESKSSDPKSKSEDIKPQAEDASKPKDNFLKLTAPDAIRAFSGLIAFKRVMNNTIEDYKEFVHGQNPRKTLTFESFQKIKALIIKSINKPEDYAALIWSILCKDLGKVKSVIETHKSFAKDSLVGHYKILAEVLQKNIPDMFPSFTSLKKHHQEQIIQAFSSECDISMLEQLELPVNSIYNLAVLNKDALVLFSIATIFHVAGAAANAQSIGSFTMHQETWSFFENLHNCLLKLYQEIPATPEEVYEEYLTFRGKCIGITLDSKGILDHRISFDHGIALDNGLTLDSSELTDLVRREISTLAYKHSVALIRTAGLARYATPAHGKVLLSAWQKLTKDERNVLVDELNIHGGQDRRAILIAYAVSMLCNPQIALLEKYKTPFNEEGLIIGLKCLALAFAKTRSMMINDKTFVAECGAIAKKLAKEPGQLIQEDELIVSISVTAQSDRRIDLDINPIPTNELAKKAAESKENNKSSVTKFGKFQATIPKPVAEVSSSSLASAPKVNS